MILHGLKWITKFLLVPLVADQQLFKIYPCEKIQAHLSQRWSSTDVSQQHKMTCILSELPASDFVFE